MHILSITFPFDERASEITKKIEQLLARPRDESGAGFGKRDLQFSFTTKSTAERTKARVESVLRNYFEEGVTVVVHERKEEKHA